MSNLSLRNDETIISSISVTDIFFDVYLGKWNYRAIPKVKTWSYFLTIPKEVLKMKIIGKPVEILLVEDNKGDIGLIEEVFEEAKIRNNIHVAEDGEEAVLYLRGGGKFSGSPRPDIILLDLNLPKKDGREVLKEIKEDNNLKNIPVVILGMVKK